MNLSIVLMKDVFCKLTLYNWTLFIKSTTVFTFMAGIKFVTSLGSTYLRMALKIIINLLF